jgi:CBS-domain-containing membrane protein
MRNLLRAIPCRLRIYASAMFGFGLICYLSLERGSPLMLASLSSSACLLFAAPESPAARLKNMVLGHVISAAVGVTAGRLLGTGALASLICVAVSAAVMEAADSMHPPAAATSLLAMSSDLGYGFVLTPVALGVCVFAVTVSIIKRLLGLRIL